MMYVENTLDGNKNHYLLTHTVLQNNQHNDCHKPTLNYRRPLDLEINLNILMGMIEVFFYTFHTFWNVGLSVLKKRKKRGKKEKIELLLILSKFIL